MKEYINVGIALCVILLICIFCFLSKSNNKTKAKYELNSSIGVTTANCPYCNVELKKFPGRKTKCKNCGNFIYVRTRPADNKKILIKEEEKISIEGEWAKRNGVYDIFLERKNEFESVKQELIKKRNTTNITDNDVNWVLYQNKRLNAANLNQWADYGFYTEQMADILYDEKKYLPALAHYIETEYFRICCGGNADGFMSKTYIKKLNKSPMVLSCFIDCMEKLNITTKDVKKIFMDLTIINAPFPLEREEAWKYIKKGIEYWE